MATKVNGLIQKVNPGNDTQYSIASTAYGYCETAAVTAAKVVDMTGFTLLEGTTIHVKFKNNNTAASPTLNVNGTGAKPIVQYGTTAASTGDATTGWYAGAVVSFTYDGTSWVRDQGFNTGTVTSITPGNGLLNGTTTNAITTSGTLNINYGTTTAKIGTAAAGSATTVSRSDHVHAIDLATGDANGQVKIAGTNISVKGIENGYLNIHPENTPILIPFMHNDIAHLLKRGGSISATYDGNNVSYDFTNAFDGSGSYVSVSNSTYSTLILTINLHKTFTWTNTIYVDFGAAGWRAKSIKIEVMNSNYANDTWTQKYNITTNGAGHISVITSHTPSGASNAGGGFNKIRFTFSDFNSTDRRIAQLGIYNFGSIGLRETYMSRGVDDYVFRNITPNANNTYSLGDTNYKWANIYATTFYGNLSGNATSASAVKDYNNNTLTKFGYSTSGMTSTSWLGSWDASTSGEYRLRAISPANAIKSGIGTTAIGKASLPVYWNGSNFATITSYEGKAATAGAADTATKATQDGSGNVITSTYVKKAGDIMTGTLSLKPASGEGGELHLCASTENTNQAGIILDQLNSTFRIFGIPSADGTTKTGTGTPLIIDPYAKTITGGYTLTGSLSGNATSAGKWATARTLTIGNKGQSVDGSQDVSWTLHDILNGSQIGTSTTWQQYNPGVYYVASNAAFTGEGNPEDANGGLTPYRYGQLIVSRAGNGGVAQFYISHQDSGNSGRGIKYRSGWNSTYNASWDTLLDSTNYTNYTVTKTGTGASGTWDISITGNAATATKFASNQSVALTGDVTGSASSQAGWSIATTLANSGVTANTYGNTSQQTPSHGGTFNIPYFKVDAKGRVTQAGTTTVKLPADSNTDTKVTQNNTTAANDYRVLLSASANDTAETNTVNKSTNLRYNPSTNTLSTGNITGTGNLDITGNANLNGETYAESITAGSLLVNGNANFVQIPTAPTPAATSNDTSVATTAFVMNAFTANDAMVFKGVVNANGNLPATHKQGWTYRVATAGTYAGKVCEVGDIIICVTDGTAANNDHWSVIQTNIDGAVIGPASATTNAIARYNGTTGKIIKNSNVTIDDTGNITTPGNINLSTGGANIVWNSDTWQQRIKTTDDSTADTPVFTFQQSSNSGSAWTDLMTIKDNGKVVATTFVGALDGNASTATKATQDESGNNIKASYASSFSISGHTITLQNKNGTSLGTVTVPDNDTKNTAGSTDTSNKIYLIGATSQADNPQTYSDSEIYVQNGTLYAVKTQDLSGTANNKPALIVGGADTSTHMEFDANEIQAKTNGTSVAQLYINNDGGLVTVGSGGLAVSSLTASQAVSTDANKKLVSTNLTVTDPTASGTGITYIATISQGATGKITATKSTVRTASTSQTGVIQITTDNANSFLNQLGTGSSTPVDADYYISQYVGGGTTTTTYHRRPMSALWEYVKGKITAGTYWANIKITDAAKYNAAPEMATLKLNGNTSATAASTSNVTLVYDTTLQALNFVFA